MVRTRRSTEDDFTDLPEPRRRSARATYIPHRPNDNTTPYDAYRGTMERTVRTRRSTQDEFIDTPEPRRRLSRATSVSGQLVETQKKCKPEVKKRSLSDKFDSLWNWFLIVSFIALVVWFFFGPALKPDKDTPLVLILGAEGADKSTFIRTLRGQSGNLIEHDAGTTKIKSFYTSMLKGPVELLDTPDFMDDMLSDAEMFEDISFTVATMLENGRKLYSVIYVMNGT